MISFEVDDQSGEDLATGLDRLRAVPGVHDVLQMAAFGKKGRLATHVQVLAAPEALDAAVAACFGETTTIGLRTHWWRAAPWRRRFAAVEVDGQTVSGEAPRRAARRRDGQGGGRSPARRCIPRRSDAPASRGRAVGRERDRDPGLA